MIAIVSVLQGAPVGLKLFFAVFCVGSGVTGLTLTILGNRSPVEREATSEEDSPAGP